MAFEMLQPWVKLRKNVDILHKFVYNSSQMAILSTGENTPIPSQSTLYRRAESGELSRVMPGLFVEAGTFPTDARVMQWVTLRQPKVIMNLISALAYHKLTTRIPDYLSIALPRGVRAPVVPCAYVRPYFVSPDLLTDCSIFVPGEYGGFHVTTPERTLVDCFKQRNKIGKEIFLEALRMGAAKFNIDTLMREASRLRALRSITPYLTTALT